jgi:hypothetical protein
MIVIRTKQIIHQKICFTSHPHKLGRGVCHKNFVEPSLGSRYCSVSGIQLISKFAVALNIFMSSFICNTECLIIERKLLRKQNAFSYTSFFIFQNKAIKSTELERQSTGEKLYKRNQNVETTKSIKMAK